MLRTITPAKHKCFNTWREKCTTETTASFRNRRFEVSLAEWPSYLLRETLALAEPLAVFLAVMLTVSVAVCWLGLVG